MKKFCAIFALFCAIFIISCDEDNSSNSNGNSDTTDTGETETDEDAADTDSTDTESTDTAPTDTESSDSEPADSEPDTSDTTPDESTTGDDADLSDSGENTDPTDSEPDDNADSESDDDTDTAEPEPTEAEKCADAGGNWNAAETSCTKIAECTKPEHTVWNDNGENGRFPQEWTGTEWTPESYESEYSTEAEICKYKCENNYFWTGSECVNPCDDNPCTGIDHSTGVCNASAWNKYTCGCENNYFWTGSECVNPCADNPCTGIDHSTGVCNASAWNSYSCGCENYYLWKETMTELDNHGHIVHSHSYSCVNPCDGIAHADGTWTQGTWTQDGLWIPNRPDEYNCGCEKNYSWNGSECAVIPECSPSSGAPCKSGNLMWSKKTTYIPLAASLDSISGHCDNLTEGGYDDWRLPNIDELKTLITNCTDGSCSKIGDTDILASSTQEYDERHRTYWWYVNFSIGSVDFWIGPADWYFIRCVR